MHFIGAHLARRHPGRLASWFPAMPWADDRLIRRAYEQREATLVDRPDFTVIRGQLPDFMRDPARTR